MNLPSISSPIQNLLNNKCPLDYFLHTETIHPERQRTDLDLCFLFKTHRRDSQKQKHPTHWILYYDWALPNLAGTENEMPDDMRYRVLGLGNTELEGRNSSRRYSLDRIRRRVTLV